MANGNNKRLKAWVRYDGTGRVVPGGPILQATKPKVGNWKEIDAYECCNPTPSSSTTTTTTTSQGFLYFYSETPSDICNQIATPLTYPNLIDCNTSTLVNVNGVLDSLPAVVYIGGIDGFNYVQWLRIGSDFVRISNCTPC